MKIIRKSRSVKSKYVGITGEGWWRGGEGDIAKRVYSDEIPLPDYSFLTFRSSYFLEKQDPISSAVSAAWHKLSLNHLIK